MPRAGPGDSTFVDDGGSDTDTTNSTDEAEETGKEETTVSPPSGGAEKDSGTVDDAEPEDDSDSGGASGGTGDTGGGAGGGVGTSPIGGGGSDDSGGGGGTTDGGGDAGESGGGKTVSPPSDGTVDDADGGTGTGSGGDTGGADKGTGPVDEAEGTTPEPKDPAEPPPEPEQGVEQTADEQTIQDQAAAFEQEFLAGQEQFAAEDVRVTRQDDTLSLELTRTGREIATAEELGITEQDITLTEEGDVLGATPTGQAELDIQSIEQGIQEEYPDAQSFSIDREGQRYDVEVTTGAGRDVSLTFDQNLQPEVEPQRQVGGEAFAGYEPSARAGVDTGATATEQGVADLSPDTEGPYIPSGPGTQSVQNLETIRSAEVDQDVLEAYRGEEVEGFRSDRTMQAGLLDAEQEETLQGLAQGYSETVTDITGLEGSTGVSRGIRGLGTGAAQVGNLPQWALGIETVAETASKTPEVVAQEGLSDTLGTFTAGGRETAEKAGEAVAEDPVGTTSQFVGGLAVGLGAGAVGRRALVSARGRLGTRNMEFQGDIDISDLERPDVSSGTSRLTRFSEDAVPGGKRSIDTDDFPVESAPGDPTQELKNLATEFSDPDLEDALGTQSDEFTLFSARSGTKGESFTPRSGRPYDPDAAFFSGSVSSNFLDVPGGSGALSSGVGLRLPRPIQGGRSLVRAAKGEDTPTIVATTGKIDEIPEGVTGQAAESQFLRQRSGSGTFYTRRPETQSGEAEALISARAADKDVEWTTTTESEATTFVRAGDPFKTQYQGETVPIQLFRPATKSDVDSPDVDTFSQSELSDAATSRSVPGGQSGTPAAPTPIFSQPSATATTGTASPTGGVRPTSATESDISPTYEPILGGSGTSVVQDPTTATSPTVDPTESTLTGISREPPTGSPTEPVTSPTEPPASPTEPPTSPTEPPTSPTEPPTSPTQPPSSPSQPPGSPTEPPTSPTTPPSTPPPTPPTRPPQYQLPDSDTDEKEFEPLFAGLRAERVTEFVDPITGEVLREE